MAGKVVKVEGYSTHQQALVKYACMAKAGDSIVELGCGFYSTPLLDSIAYVNKVTFKCYYQEIAWQKTVEPLCPNTEFIHVEDWNVWKLEHDAHLVMLDNEELVVNRFKQIERSLIKKAKYILCHDADIYPKRGINLVDDFTGELFNSLVPHTFVIDCQKATPKLNQPRKKVWEEEEEEPFCEVIVPTEMPNKSEIEIEPEPPVNHFANGSKPNNRRTRNPKTAHGLVDPIPLVETCVNGKNVLRVSDTYTNGVKPLIPCQPLEASEMPRLLKRRYFGQTAVVCCFTAGGEYDEYYEEYIKRLSEGVQENTTDDIDIYCITIMNIDSIECVTKIQPLKTNWKGWHIKAEIFREDLWRGYDRVLYIDLDTQITGNIDNIVNSDSRLMMLRDFYKPAIWETGMIYFAPSDFKGLYSKILKMNPIRSVKDANIISDFVRERKIEPEFFQDNFKVGSYKVSLLRDEMHQDDFQIVCYHGNPRPHHIGWDLNNRTKITGPMGNRVRSALKKKHKTVTVEENWKGEDVFIIGGGPSLKGIDLDKLLEGQKVLGINDGYLYDCCDVCFFGDTVWHGHHRTKLADWGKDIYSTSGVQDDNVMFLDLQGQGLTDDPTTLGWNSNSGFAGMNLALHLGAKRIFLLGFDMSFGKDGESNWHKNIRKVNKNTYDCFLRTQKRIRDDFDRLFSDREIFVLTTPDYDSEIRMFPRVSFHELLEVDEEELYIKEEVNK